MNRYPRVDRCHVDIYIASNMRYRYPFKLLKPEHATQPIRDSAAAVILDSGIGDDTTNREVLDLAHELDADFVIAKDYLHDRERTTESVHEFLDLYDDHDCRATPLIPLQPPYDEHYLELSGHPAYVLGGVMQWRGGRIIDELQRFRAVAGSGPYAHLLGVGASPALVQAVARDPTLIQSLDCSTPEQCAINGQTFGLDLKQRPIRLASGTGSGLSRSDHARELAMRINDAFHYAEPRQTLADYGTEAET